MRPGKEEEGEDLVGEECGWGLGWDWPLMISLMVMRECSSEMGPVGVGGLEG